MEGLIVMVLSRLDEIQKVLVRENSHDSHGLALANLHEAFLLTNSLTDCLHEFHVDCQGDFYKSPSETPIESPETLSLVCSVSDCNHEYDHAEKCILCGVLLEDVESLESHETCHETQGKLINPLQNRLHSFRICIYREEDNHQTKVESFPSEIAAQNAFDDLTRHGSEFGGYLRCDLVVHHVELGPLVRRSMFIDE